MISESKYPVTRIMATRRPRVMCETEIFTIDESWLTQLSRDERSGSKLYLSLSLATKEKEVIEEALRKSRRQIFGPSGAAAKLGIARSTLESKIQLLIIDKNRFKESHEVETG